MRDALRGSDQQLYFRILSSVELLLPISVPAVPGQAPVGWGTWTTGGRTHVLAFTSVEAMRVCLGEHGGSTRRIGYAELAAGWPNHEWWLAVDPGLPIEGYLPAWYVAQLSRGDVRLPGRTVGARARLERVEALNRLRESSQGMAPPPAATVPTAPAQRPAPLRPDRPAAPPPVVPTAFQLPDVPVAAPGTVTGVRGQPPAGHPEPGRFTPAAVEQRPALDDSRPPGLGGARPGAVGGPLPDSQNDMPPRQPRPASGEPPVGPVRSRPVTVERPGTRTNGQPADPGADQTRRSFFEPASGRPAPRSDRLAERATPPSRFARGGQPFPRRGPAADPAADGNSRAFVFTDDAQNGGAARPDVNGEATQPPAVGPSQDPTRPLRVTTPNGPTNFGPAAAPAAVPEVPPTADSANVTQTLPPRQSPERGEDLAPSAAEPVSGPPAPRRGFTPIVIEGTIIEARDLTAAPPTQQHPGPEPRQRPAPEAGSGPARPAAGSTTTDLPGRLADPEPTAPIFLTGSEPTSPIFPVGSEPTTPIFPVEAEPTAPIFAAEAEPTARIATVEPEATVAMPTPAPEPTIRTDAVGLVPGEPATSEPSLFAPSPSGGATDGPALVDPATPTPEASDARAASMPGAEPTPAATPFEPANEVEEDLLAAVGAANTDTFLSTLLLARVLMPVAADSAPGSRPGDPGYVWPTVELDGQTFVVVYTSPQRLADHADPAAETMKVRFVQLIRCWPDLSWSFAVNPGTPVGAKLPGEQIVGLANWAAELGLGDDSEQEPEPSVDKPASTSSPQQAAAAADPTRPIVMQKAIAPSQLGYYLERGYDRVSGFVHRATELAHLTTPAQLYHALGLSHPESPFAADAEEIYVLRWPAYRPSLYRIPYGGQNEAAMRAMEGWVIERPPFRGNGFAPGESREVLAEFKVDSVRLPHGAQLLRLGADGTQRLVAVLDADTLAWREVGEP
ncbi:hypothetical protein E0H26_23380 [Micromonospora zingiberis]|uniref:SseB protein N-terminal domain-containing protein n=2 Tax=Micromonospora zingiberis TaxID=2053011 RepID=A0A4R0G8E4_9ACTN|nr:hypothetical protein E0H26_23380 [Micromonospora zingiberis]